MNPNKLFRHFCQTIARRSTGARIFYFWLVFLLVYLPPALVLYSLGTPDSWLAIGIYCAFVFQIGWWGRSIGGQAHPYRYYGLAWDVGNLREFAGGLGLSLLCFSLLMLNLLLMGGLQIQEVNWIGALPSGLLTAIGVGFAEELLFRGWLLRELEQGYSKSMALGVNSVIFAILHFIKPLEVILATWVQFPGLVGLGLILGRACHLNHGRLGQAIGIHTGLVWGYFVVNTTQWLVPTGNLPEWLTGIGGNPLAGVMGLLYLGIMGLCLKKVKQN